MKQREEKSSPDGRAYGEMCRRQSWHADVTWRGIKGQGICVCVCVSVCAGDLITPQRIITRCCTINDDLHGKKKNHTEFTITNNASKRYNI